MQKNCTSPAVGRGFACSFRENLVRCLTPTDENAAMVHRIAAATGSALKARLSTTTFIKLAKDGTWEKVAKTGVTDESVA